MGEIVNLRQRKKQLARVKSAAQAAENAAKFGRTKEQKAFEQAQAAQARRLLDGAQRDET